MLVWRSAPDPALMHTTIRHHPGPAAMLIAIQCMHGPGIALHTSNGCRWVLRSSCSGCSNQLSCVLQKMVGNEKRTLQSEFSSTARFMNSTDHGIRHNECIPVVDALEGPGALALPAASSMQTAMPGARYSGGPAQWRVAQAWGNPSGRI